jgi:aryl-alcohol dehydrogenase-like predicted oxidoreductase
MRTRRNRLGPTGPEVSVIGFGAWEAGGGSEWGESPPEEQVLEAIRTVFDTGIDWIDTAEVYGRGRSEELVGRAIEGRRDEISIFTKVAPQPDGSGFRAAQVRSACEASLRRLGTGHIDLYQLHWPDERGTTVEETWGAMTELVDDGLVRSIGVSNFDRDLIERCEAIRHVDSLQQEFSMLRLEDRDLIRWCGEQGTGVLSYGPLAYGLLTGAVTSETRFDRGDFRGGDEEGGSLFVPGNRERNLAFVEALRPIAERLGITLPQLALAWNVAQPGVTAAIAGSRNPDHVRSNAAAGDIVLDEATLSELDTIVSRAASGHHGPNEGI